MALHKRRREERDEEIRIENGKSLRASFFSYPLVKNSGTNPEA
jgi:hypothetical protein